MPRVLDVNGLRVTVEEPPEALHPPILMVPGMFAGAWMFERYQRYFAERGYPCYAVDLRGRPGSRPVGDLGQVSVRDYVEDGVSVARALGRPVVMGHSMGGLIAQKIAEADAAMALVLLCAAPPRGISPFGGPLVRHLLPYLGDILRSRPLFPTRADADAVIFSHTPRAQADEEYPRLLPESGRAARELSLGAVAVDARRVRCPVLSVGAAEDRFVAPRVARALARKYGASLLEFARHGHQLITEPGWEEPAAAIERWLAQAIHTAEHPQLRDTLVGVAAAKRS